MALAKFILVASAACCALMFPPPTVALNVRE
jgi:hypothetical protein